MLLDTVVPGVLMSVRPRFADGLLDGSKTVEIRRTTTRIERGSVCLLYSSSPQRALVGTVEVAETHVADPSTLWRRWGRQMGLARDEFDAYVEGCRQATAIVVEAPRRLAEPIPLTELRDRHAGFVTPQSYRYLDADEREILLGAAASPPLAAQ